MTSQTAFTFDASFCSGCKACQAACKDKNNLPPGVLWRRVFEVTGGTWQQNGEAWSNTVFAYSLSISCNHCLHPKCAGVCPTNAYVIREDSIVFLDATKCMGCGYCAWACPYGAPQYDPHTGRMTKCDGCIDNLTRGYPPACVSACPLRVLDYRNVATDDRSALDTIRLWERPAEEHPYPLPVHSHTQPRLVIKQHPAMERKEERFVANHEEIQPRSLSSWEDMPLIMFTLLVQMAVGGFWAMTWMFQPLWLLVASDSTYLRTIPALLVGLCLGIGMFAAFAHLGTKHNAWRALGNLRRSRLSREILFLAVFGAAWLLTTLATVLEPGIQYEWMAITSILGIGLIHNMAEVYRLPAAPTWNTWRTNASFLVSALLLGTSVMAPLLAYESHLTGIRVFPSQWAYIAGVVSIPMLTQLVLGPKRSVQPPLYDIRLGLMLVGIALNIVSYLWSILDPVYASMFLFLVVLTEESLGRCQFYRSRTLLPTIK